MDWAAILSSHGLATLIVIAGGVGVVMVARFCAPLIRELVATLVQFVTTVEDNTTATKDAVQGINATLSNHQEILATHTQRLEQHGKLLQDIHSKVHGKTP